MVFLHDLQSTFLVWFAFHGLDYDFDCRVELAKFTLSLAIVAVNLFTDYAGSPARIICLFICLFV